MKIAYTLNNRQPVTCTIIGTEPLYYLDDAHAKHKETPPESTLMWCAECNHVTGCRCEEYSLNAEKTGYKLRVDFVCNRCETLLACVFGR